MHNDCVLFRVRETRERLAIPECRRAAEDGMISLAKAAERLKICVGSNETCQSPAVRQFYGSGGRAAAALAGRLSGVVLHTLAAPTAAAKIRRALSGTVTLRCRERGLCDRVPPRGHRRSAKRTV